MSNQGCQSEQKKHYSHSDYRYNRFESPGFFIFHPTVLPRMALFLPHPRSISRRRVQLSCHPLQLIWLLPKRGSKYRKTYLHITAAPILETKESTVKDSLLCANTSLPFTVDFHSSHEDHSIECLETPCIVIYTIDK